MNKTVIKLAMLAICSFGYITEAELQKEIGDCASITEQDSKNNHLFEKSLVLTSRPLVVQMAVNKAFEKLNERIPGSMVERLTITFLALTMISCLKAYAL